jgi:hypothetical protein
VGDASRPATAAAAVAKAVERFGGLDGLYHVAGGSGRGAGDGPLGEVTDEGWQFTLRLNLDSLFYSNRAAVRQLLQQGPGEADCLHLWWLGQSGFLLQWQCHHLLLDPYLSDSLTQNYSQTDKPHVRMTEFPIDPVRLDFIDIATSSHNHTDHLDADTLRPLLPTISVPEWQYRVTLKCSSSTPRHRMNSSIPAGGSDSRITSCAAASAGPAVRRSDGLASDPGEPRWQRFGCHSQKPECLPVRV